MTIVLTKQIFAEGGIWQKSNKKILQTENQKIAQKAEQGALAAHKNDATSAGPK